MLRHLLLVALLAAPLAAQAIDTINGVALPFSAPADIVESSVGTQLTLVGTGFGGLTGLAKPKVFINSVAAPKKRALKVVSFTDTQVVCEVKTGVAGDFDLTLQPKGKGLLPLVAQAAVRIVPPVFEQPTPGVVAPNSPVALSGFSGPETFGTRKGKVKVGGKPAVVQSWTADEIVFLMPSKLADGIYTVEVKNTIGTATVELGVETAPFCLQMDGSAFDAGGPDRLSCRIGKKAYKTNEGFFSLFVSPDPGPPATLGISAPLSSGFPARNLNVKMPLDLATATFPVIIHGSADGHVEFTQMETFLGEVTTWTTDFDGEGADDWLIVLNSYKFNAETGGNQLAGAFSAKLQRTSGTVSPASCDVTLGDFRATVDP
jgi:hypothetical protein